MRLDRDLEQRIRNVLMGLRMVSEGKSARFPDSIAEPQRQEPRQKDETGRREPRSQLRATHSRHRESSPPAAAPPDYDHWHRRIESAIERQDRSYLTLTVASAEEALYVARHAPRHIGADGHHEDHRHKTKRMVEDHVGMSPEEVAAKFRCSPAHVRAARIRYAPFGDPDSRDPETGEPREGDPRIGKALQLAEDGSTFRGIALRLGVSVGTVQRWLQGRDRAA